MSKTTICAALAATLLAAGCASTGGQEGPAGNAPELAGKTFMWAEAVSENCELPPTITFGADGRVSGNAGCNNLIGGWKLEGKAITMGPLGSTMKMCAPEFMEVEQKFLGILNQVAFVTSEGEGITLWSKDEEKLVTLVPEKAGNCK